MEKIVKATKKNVPRIVRIFREEYGKSPWNEKWSENAAIKRINNYFKDHKIFVLKINNNIESKIYLDKDQLKLLDFLDQVGRITTKDAIDVLNCSKRTVQLKLSQLKKLGIIIQIGKGPSSAYILR